MLKKYLSLAVAAVIACGACSTPEKTVDSTKNAKTAKQEKVQPAKKAEKAVSPSFKDIDRKRLARKPEQPVQLTPAEQKSRGEYDKKLSELNAMFFKREQKKAIEGCEAIAADAKALNVIRARAANMVCSLKSHNDCKDFEGAIKSVDAYLPCDFLTSADRAVLLRIKANILKTQKRNAEAIDVLKVRLAEQISKNDAIGTKIEIVSLYTAQKDYFTATALVEEMLQTDAALMDEPTKARLLRDLSYYYRELKDFNKITATDSKRMALCSKADDKADIQIDYANWLMRLKKTDEAMKILTEVASDPQYTNPARLRACVSAMDSVRNIRRVNKRRMMYVLGNTVLKDSNLNPMKGKPAFADANAEVKARADEDLTWTAAALNAQVKEANNSYINSLITILRFVNGDLPSDTNLRSAFASLLVNTKEANLNQKLSGYSTLLNIALNKGDYDEANRVIAIALKDWNGKDENTYASLMGMKAQIFCAQEKMNEAVKLLKAEIAAGHDNKQMRLKLVDVYRYFCLTEETANAQLEAGDYYGALGTLSSRYPDKAIALAEKWLNDEKCTENQRIAAMELFLTNTPKAKMYRAKYPDLLAKVSSHRIIDSLRVAISNGDYDRCLDMLALLDKSENGKKNYESKEIALQVYAVLHKDAEIAKLAKSVAENPAFNAEQKRKISFGAGFIVLSDKKGETAKYFNTFKFEKDVKPQDKANLLLYAGSLAMNAKKFTLAEDSYGVYLSLFKSEPKKTYTIKFSDEPIRGLAGFQSLKDTPEKQLMDRKFGGNMDFLVTDVSTGNRGAVGGATDGDAYVPSEMQMACDEYGLHMLFTAYDSKSKAIEAGLEGAGSFEMYFAPGENQPYMCFLPDLTDGTNHIWQTTYNTAQWTRLDDNKDMKSERIFTKSGYQLYMSVSWTNFYDKLPEDGYFWEFENIHWSRFGGYSWNGIKTIHGRSTWGKLMFTLTPEQVLKIKKHIIYTARQAYNAEKRTSGAKHGVIDKYANDPLQGDPAFYKAKVAPIVDNLDALQALVKEDMDAATINKLYKEAVPGWFNIRYIIDDLHRRYLEELLSK